MVVIKVELWPHGKQEGKRELAHMVIANTGQGTADEGEYLCTMKAEYGVRKGKMVRFRRRSQSVWSLVGGFLKLFGHTKHSPKDMTKE